MFSANASQRIAELEGELAASRRALSRANARLQIFSTQTAFWMWETDGEHRFVHVSDNVQDICGIPVDEVLASNWLETVKGHDTAEWKAHAADLEAHRPFESFRFERHDVGGAVRHHVLSGWPVFDQTGRFRGYRGVGRDESADVMARERVRAVEARYTAEIEAQRDHLLKRTEDFANQTECWFWETDAEHVFTYVSDNIERLAGTSPTEVIATSRFDLKPAASDDPDWREHLDDLKHHRRFDAFHYMRTDKAGTARHTVVSGWPRFDRSGNFLGYRGTARDETATVKRYEEQTRREQDYIAEIERHNGEIEKVLSNLSQGIFWFDAERKVRFQNARIAEVLDLRIGELADCRTALECMRLMAARGDFGSGDPEALAVSQTDMMFDAKTGATRRWWLKSIDRHLRSRYGRLKDGGLIVTFVDVSEEVATEQQLAEARDEIARHTGEIEKVLSNLSQGIFWFDEDRKVRFQNARAAEIFGIPVEQLNQCTTALAFMRLLAKRGEFGSGDVEALAMSQTDAMFDPMTGAMSRWWLKSCDRHLRCRYGRLDDGGLIVTFVDITEEVITEQQLASARDEARKLAAQSAEREHNLQTVLDNLSQSIMWMDTDREVKLRNRKMSEMHGFSEADYADVHTFDDHLRLLAARGDMGEGSMDEIIKASIARIFSPLEGPTDYRRHFPTIDRHFLVRLAPTPGGGRILSEIDITEQVKAEQQLEVALSELEAMNAVLEEKVEDRTRELRQTQANLVDAERAATLGKLTAKLSHELRNPLNALNTSLYIIRAKAGADEKIARALDRSERTVQRCTNILADLYDFAMTIEAKPREVDLGRWLNQTLAQAEPPEGVELRIDNRLEGLECTIDEGQIRKALMKVFDNAVMAVTHEGLARPQRIVSVTGAQAGERLEIIIADNGCGMDEGTASQALEPLFSTRGFGVGLGLPIAEQTFSRHGGGLKFHSRQNEGTTVTLWLPADQTTDDDTQEAA